jgi:hypothetical protein
MSPGANCLGFLTPFIQKSVGSHHLNDFKGPLQSRTQHCIVPSMSLNSNLNAATQACRCLCCRMACSGAGRLVT